jgi:hypothetical protein
VAPTATSAASDNANADLVAAVIVRRTGMRRGVTLAPCASRPCLTCRMHATAGAVRSG